MKSGADFNMARDLQINSMQVEIDGILSLLIIALCHARLVATLELFYQGRVGGIAVVHNFYVRPDYRKRGIGTKLIHLAADLATKEGCTDLALGVDKANDGAIEFYQRAGFTICTKSLPPVSGIPDPVSS
jgi:ribosomal protein S18 acetylase RimI-like enzyme